ncbi:MAG: lysophospholipase, partial [Alphaproteobacteria bacterium]|nr:lysophospholipase [Alphaproteobacteria bacterium]
PAAPVVLAPPPAAPPPPPPPPVAAPPPPAPPAQPANTQTAALPPASADPAPAFRVAFPLNDSAVPDAGKSQIDRAADALERDPSLRLQLLAYARGDAEGASQSRRLSLARALAVRSYLIEKGVRSTRIDVRALGNRAEGGPPDRVDVVLLNR